MLLRSLMAAAALVVTAAACSCTDPAWCQPLSSPPAKQELFVFTVTPGAHANYNWTYLTTIVAFYDLSSDPTLLCEAHSRNVRVILQADDFPLANLTDASQRAAWVSTQVARVAASGADGVNVDIESPITSEDQPALLTALVSSLAMAMHAANKAYQVSFDVAWGPNNVDGRSYDYVGLGNAVDLMFVMVRNLVRVHTRAAVP